MNRIGSKKSNAISNEDRPSEANSKEPQQLREPTLRESVPRRVIRSRHNQTRPLQDHSRVSTSPRSFGPDELVSYNSSSTESTANTEPADQPEARATHAPLTDDSLKLWAKHIFRCGFETTFGVLLGRYGCPFVYVAPAIIQGHESRY
jgi:hypothetical protein